MICDLVYYLKNIFVFLPCVSDFKMVFRELGDIGTSRKLATPDS